MRNSPRKIRGRGGETGTGPSCQGNINVETHSQLVRQPIGELRYQAGEVHGVRNASLLSRSDLVARLTKHFFYSHGVDLAEEDRFSTPLRETKVEDEDIEEVELEVEEPELEVEEQTVLVEEDDRFLDSSRRGQVVLQGLQDLQRHEEGDLGEVEETQQYILETAAGPDEETVSDYTIINSNMRYKIGQETGDQEMVVQVLPKTVCHAYVIARTVKELRDLGRDMLRIHAENHGIEHASKLRMSELVREMIQHYNGVHNAGLEVSKLDMLKLNMLTLKKVKVDIREKTPPPDTTNMVPKNVVPLDEQVHHVYEKRPDICTVDIIVNNLKDMLALGTSILRPEASKHRVCNSSRKQKLQVVEELWEHYLKFHLKQSSDGNMVERRPGELVTHQDLLEYSEEWNDDQDYIVVSEEDIVAGEDIHTAAEEVTA